ncbi:hypothetical protein SASPL_140869 [Salvia splendens]|uniref:Uncharacterized protein n=1 Tax=Salvia splendens TaxID=180675 RepID=A0A8X8ZCV8_SALSN|nr:uncharacterized protein LOC121766752 [Salvia splendens]KAG6399389.1 hypothetical protein SASPL_140869 [Salvia splendens]
MDSKKPLNFHNPIPNPNHVALWDCGSSLYDSFELKAFERHFGSAINSRSMSMPHLSDRCSQPAAAKKSASKMISRSLQRLIRSVFGIRSNSRSKAGSGEGFFVVYDKSAALSTIPEAPEFDGVSPEIRSLVRRTASDRFSAATSVGISCA